MKLIERVVGDEFRSKKLFWWKKLVMLKVYGQNYRIQPFIACFLLLISVLYFCVTARSVVSFGMLSSQEKFDQISPFREVCLFISLFLYANFISQNISLIRRGDEGALYDRIILIYVNDNKYYLFFKRRNISLRNIFSKIFVYYINSFKLLFSILNTFN